MDNPVIKNWLVVHRETDASSRTDGDWQEALIN